MLEEKWVERIASELSLKTDAALAACRLLENGATPFFIAHYRKDATGGLDESMIEALAERCRQAVNLVNRRKAILNALEAEGALTDELRTRIEACDDKMRLEDIYLPYKTKRRTRATTAIEQGLGPLADFIMKQLPGIQTVDEFAEAFVRPDKSISSSEEALEGTRYILIERFSMDPDIRALILNFMLEHGTLTVRPAKNADGAKTRYESFFGLSEPLAKISPAKLLGILRGAKEGMLRVDIVIDEVRMFNILLNHGLTDPNSVFGAQIRLALIDAYARHLRPMMEKEALEFVRRRAEAEAIRTCRENARNALMGAPAGPVPVIGVAVAKSGCRLAAVGSDGDFIESLALPPLDKTEDAQAAEDTLRAFMDKHGIYVLAMGNAAGTRETAKRLNAILAKLRRKGAYLSVESSAAATAYASSQSVVEALPDVEPEVREAVFMARRFQDPLAVLAGMEPRHIGVGPLQYEVNQKQLREGLTKTIVSCVSQTGVDVNTAPLELLRYVSGLPANVAQNIIKKRTELGGFTSRAQLAEVEGMTPKIFEQCAGLLRIRNGVNPLDDTPIHPEAYGVVEQLAANLKMPVSAMIGQRRILAHADMAPLQTETIGPLAMEDIRTALMHPGDDPRGRFHIPHLYPFLSCVEDLKEDMELEGVVTKLVDFGVFVDIGALQDGLIHLSELSNRYVRDPRRLVKPGQIVRVKVIKVDKETPRISLSVKALLDKPKDQEAGRPERARRGERPGASVGGGQSETGPALEEKRPARSSRRTDTRRISNDESESRKRQARRPRPEDGSDNRRGGDKRAERPERADRKPDRGPRRSSGDQKGATYGDTGGNVNTLLADQLAALRGKFKS
ncbi:MAG TPA: Tex-like N-terminal domain-containing protein [Candidatus Hydrogenedentes bacterium]|nr:Tex-like N-terminal domain-containing protein [Candidatus Hydrogenedentota bacterium]